MRSWYLMSYALIGVHACMCIYIIGVFMCVCVYTQTTHNETMQLTGIPAYMHIHMHPVRSCTMLISVCHQHALCICMVKHACIHAFVITCVYDVDNACYCTHANMHICIYVFMCFRNVQHA